MRTGADLTVQGQLVWWQRRSTAILVSLFHTYHQAPRLQGSLKPSQGGFRVLIVSRLCFPIPSLHSCQSFHWGSAQMFTQNTCACDVPCHASHTSLSPGHTVSSLLKVTALAQVLFPLKLQFLSAILADSPFHICFSHPPPGHPGFGPLQGPVTWGFVPSLPSPLPLLLFQGHSMWYLWLSLVALELPAPIAGLLALRAPLWTSAHPTGCCFSSSTFNSALQEVPLESHPCRDPAPLLALLPTAVLTR